MGEKIVNRKLVFFALILLVCLPAIILCADEAPKKSVADPALITEFPFEIASNKPWVQPRINDSEPFWFILDTSSAQTSVIEYARAVELGLDIENETETNIGAGEGVSVKMGQAEAFRSCS